MHELANLEVERASIGGFAEDWSTKRCRNLVGFEDGRLGGEGEEAQDDIVECMENNYGNANPCTGSRPWGGAASSELARCC